MDALQGRRELPGQSHQRHHHLELGRGASGGDFDPRAEHRPRLRWVELGPHQRQTDAAQPQHRVHFLGLFTQELVQRRVEQPHGHGPVADRRQQVEEVFLLRRGQLDERGGLLVGIRGEQVPPHERQPVTEELVLGTAQADALCAVPDRERRVPAVVRVGPNLEPPHSVRMPQQRFEVTARPRRNDIDGAGIDGPAAAVDRDELALGQRPAGARHRPGGSVDPYGGCAADRGPPEAPGDDGRVRGQTAAHGDDRLRGEYPGQVTRRGLLGHEDRPGHRSRSIRRPARCSARSARRPRRPRRAGHGRTPSRVPSAAAGDAGASRCRTS